MKRIHLWVIAIIVTNTFFGKPSAEESTSRIISISRGESEGRPEGAKRPTAGDEPREFTSRGEGGRVPNFFEKLPQVVIKKNRGLASGMVLGRPEVRTDHFARKTPHGFSEMAW